MTEIVTRQPTSPGNVPTRAARAVVLFAGAAILLLTLFPQGGIDERQLTGCLVCGSRGLADAVLNVILFVPLGVGFRLAGMRPLKALLTAAAFSAFIEVLQFVVPGRDPSLGDLLFNSMGGLAGAVATGWAVVWLSAQGRRSAWQSVVAVLIAVGVWWGTGALLRPSLPASTYYGQWTPRLGHLGSYRGQIHAAFVGPVELPPRRLPNPDRVRTLLMQSAPLTVTGIAGPPTRRLASLFSIYDDRQREIVLVGPDRDDMVLRHATRASMIRLDNPDVRLVGAMERVKVGDSLRVEVRLTDRGPCMAVNAVSECALGPTVSRGWALLLFPNSLPRWLDAFLGIAWLAALVAPFGLWARARWESGIGALVLLLGLTAVPALAGLSPSRPTDYCGVVIGILAGWGLRHAARAHWLPASGTATGA